MDGGGKGGTGGEVGQTVDEDTGGDDMAGGTASGSEEEGILQGLEDGTSGS